MKALLVHAKKFWYKALTKAIPNAEKIEKTPPEFTIENTLVAFVTIEKEDQACMKELAEIFSKDLKNVLHKLKISSVILYPYAHLSDKLADESTALRMLTFIEKELKEKLKEIKLVRAPFGWYKAFYLECLGHPLSELSKRYLPSEICEGKKRNFRCSFSNYGIKEFSNSVVDNICYGSRAKRLSKKLISSQALNSMKKFGLFPIVKDNKITLTYVNEGLRFLQIINQLADSFLKHMGVKYDRVYKPINGFKAEAIDEILRSGFQAFHEKSLIISSISTNKERFSFFNPLNEIIILFRFNVKDNSLKVSELKRSIYSLALKAYKSIEMSSIVVLMEGEEDLVAKDILGSFNIPFALIARSQERDQSFEKRISMIKFLFLNQLNEEPIELGSLWVTVINHELILLTNFLGPIENLLYTAFVNAALKLERGKVPSLPTWLAPTQVAILPVKKSHLNYAEEIHNMLISNGLRAEIDNRNISLGKRIRDFGKKWVPYIVVIGDREVASKTLNVRIRRLNKQVSMSPAELLEEVKQDSDILKVE